MRERQRRRWLHYAVVLAVLAVGTSPAWSSACPEFVVDQSCDALTGGMNIMYAAPFGFDFVPETSSIEFIELRTQDCSGVGADAELVAHLHEGPIDGPVLGTSEVRFLPAGHGHGFADLTCLRFSAPLTLESGTLYSVELVVLTGAVCAGDIAGNPYGIDPCPGSRGIYAGTPSTVGADVWFREGTSSTSPVVEYRWGAIKSLYRP